MLAESILILLIEDEEPHAELIIRAFTEQGSRIHIHHVKSLSEARPFMQIQRPSLIIADWRLPDGESMELLQDNNDPLSIPLILMTSYGNERIAVEALKSGASITWSNRPSRCRICLTWWKRPSNTGWRARTAYACRKRFWKARRNFGCLRKTPVT